MKIIYILIATSILFISCSQQTKVINKKNTTKSVSSDDNALLYNTVLIKQEINFFPEANKDWKESLVNSKLIEKIYTNSLKGKKVLDPYDSTTMTVEEIKEALGEETDTVFLWVNLTRE